MFLKIMDYKNDQRSGFGLYEGTNVLVNVGARSITVEKKDEPAVSIALEPHCIYFLMNSDGDTIERFRGETLLGSPERTRRVLAAIERYGLMLESAVVIQGDDGREVIIGRHVRESGSIATTLDLGEGTGPVLMADHVAGQVAAALLGGAFAPPASPPSADCDQKVPRELEVNVEEFMKPNDSFPGQLARSTS